MIRIALTILLAAVATAKADSLTVKHAIRPATIIGAGDLSTLKSALPGTVTNANEIVGLEARVILYPGRPIRPGDVGPAALVDRNQLVELVYRTGTLTIRTEGRALDRGAEGDRIRVMNLNSRSTISGIVTGGGFIIVSPVGKNS